MIRSFVLPPQHCVVIVGSLKRNKFSHWNAEIGQCVNHYGSGHVFVSDFFKKWWHERAPFNVMSAPSRLEPENIYKRLPPHWIIDKIVVLKEVGSDTEKEIEWAKSRDIEVEYSYY